MTDHKILYTAIVALALCACGGKAGSKADTTASSDSTVVAETAKVDLTPLPDTTYGSVDAVSYNVSIIDTADNGALGSLADLYLDTPGSFTFRCGERRDADFGGTVTGRPSDIVIDWAFVTTADNRATSFGSWGGGSGWTGQPLYVEWPDSMMAKFRRDVPSALTADFGRCEIMVGSLASQVYFINYDNGRASRKPIPAGNPIKGTISLDPTLNGNLYYGQGVPNERPFGARVINLFSHKVSHVYNEDPKARRRWGAYDSSPVRVGRFLFRPGENGIVYKFLVGPGTLKLHSTLNYTVKGSAPGIEASMSVYRNYGYTADNHGNILCINLETMRPVWFRSINDDTDATPVIIEENGRPYIYVGSEIDLQDVGHATFVKLDGLNGQTVWEQKIAGRRVNLEKKHFDGGFYATALPGRGNCADLIFSNVVTNQGGQTGEFIALSRETGKIVYQTKLRYYAWSSPVGFLNEKGEMFIFTGDCSGNAYLIDGKTGEIIVRKHIGSNFESSPVVVGNTVVIGSRGDKIYRLSIK